MRFMYPAGNQLVTSKLSKTFQQKTEFREMARAAFGRCLLVSIFHPANISLEISSWIPSSLPARFS
jgi:hypothetical protein